MPAPTDLSPNTPRGDEPVYNRLLRGYAPIAGLVLLLLFIAAIVPTAPEMRSSDDGDEAAETDGAAADDGATADGDAEGAVAQGDDRDALAERTPLVVVSLALVAIGAVGLYLFTRRGPKVEPMAGAANAHGPPANPGYFTRPGRVFAGYGPLAVFAVLILVMGFAIPSRAPDEEEISSEGPADAGGGFLDSDDSADDEPAVEDTDTTGDTGGGTDTTAPTTTGGGQVGTDGQGSGVAPVAGVSACSGRDQQIPGDPYSPPCVAWGGGNNGGATSQGVTGEEILVSYRVLGEQGFQQTLAQLAGASLSDTPESIQRTISAFAEYFNDRFEFFGREIRMEFYNGKGSNTNELLGKGRDKAVADAEQVEAMGAFADLSATSEPYADALADRGVVGFGTPYLSRQWHEARAPYAWSLATDGTLVSELAAEYANKRLHGKPAVYAGGDLQGKPRTFAIIAPENSWYQESVANSQRITEQAGNPRAFEIAYQLDLARMSDQANGIIPKLQNPGGGKPPITTVVCGCDPILPVFLSGVADRSGYYPEFIITGTALTDSDIVGQLWDQEFASHAFGISSLEPFVPPEQTLAYRVFKEMRPDAEPAFSVQQIYYQMYMLAIGIQGAGPNLTPQSMSDGLFNYPARNGPVGRWQFGVGDRTAANDVREIYWDPSALSPYNRQPGTYKGTSGSRWLAGSIPAGDPGVPR